MKLIIDIPDRIHYAIKLGITVNGSDASQMLIDAVKNGIPLDKIRAEIKEIIKLYEGSCDQDLGIKWGYEGALEIIDKYRGES